MTEIIKFFSQTCVPCKRVDFELNQLGITLKSVDIASKDPQDISLISKYRIRSVPTIVIDSGSSIKVAVGNSINKEFYQEIKNAELD